MSDSAAQTLSKSELIVWRDSESLEDAVKRNTQMGWPDVSAKHQLICHAMAEHGDVKKAAEDHGCSPAQVRAVMRSPLSRAYYNYIMDRVSQETLISRQFLEDRLLSALEQASGEQEIHLIDKDGCAYTAKQTDVRAQVAVLKEMKALTPMADDMKGAAKGSGQVKVEINLGAMGVSEDEYSTSITIDQEPDGDST